MDKIIEIGTELELSTLIEYLRAKSYRYPYIKEFVIRDEKAFITLTNEEQFKNKGPYTLIPDKVLINENGITFIQKKSFVLSEFPEVLDFFKNHSPHITKFIEDVNLTYVSYQYEDLASEYPHLDRKINNFKTLDGITSNQELIKILIFAEVVRKFHQGQDSPLYESDWKLSTNIDKLNRNMINHNISFSQLINIFISNPINIDFLNTNDVVQRISYGYQFKFLENKIFEPSRIEPFIDFMELRFLYFIATGVFMGYITGDMITKYKMT